LNEGTRVHGSKNDDGAAEFEAVLQATYAIADVLRPQVASPKEPDPLEPIQAEVTELVDACSGDRQRVHSDDDFDAIVNAGLELFRQMNETISDPADLPPELREKCKALLEACIKAGLISMDEV